MALKVNETNAKLLAKFPWQTALIILLSAISVLFGLIIKSNMDDKKYQNERIEYLRNYIKSIEGDKAVWLNKETAKDAEEIQRQQILIDSLQKLILTRTDKSYEELKDILNIKSGKTSIKITPKKKK